MDSQIVLIAHSGRVLAENNEGTLRTLAVGDSPQAGESILTDASSAATLMISGNGSFDLGPEMRWEVGSDLPAGESLVASPVTLGSTHLSSDLLSPATGNHSGSSFQSALEDVFAVPAFEMSAVSDIESGVSQAGQPDLQELVADATGLLRALEGMLVDTDAASQLQDAREALSRTLTVGAEDDTLQSELSLALESALGMLSQAEVLAYDTYLQHAPRQDGHFALGEGVPGSAELHGAIQTPADLPEPVLEFQSEAIPFDLVLDDVTSHSLGDILHVETAAGASRMTIHNVTGEELASVWLETGVTAVGSLLGFDAPEFALAGQDAS